MHCKRLNQEILSKLVLVVCPCEVLASWHYSKRLRPDFLNVFLIYLEISRNGWLSLLRLLLQYRRFFQRTLKAAGCSSVPQFLPVGCYRNSIGNGSLISKYVETKISINDSSFLPGQFWRVGQLVVTAVGIGSVGQLVGIGSGNGRHGSNAAAAAVFWDRRPGWLASWPVAK